MAEAARFDDRLSADRGDHGPVVYRSTELECWVSVKGERWGYSANSPLAAMSQQEQIEFLRGVRQRLALGELKDWFRSTNYGDAGRQREAVERDRRRAAESLRLDAFERAVEGRRGLSLGICTRSRLPGRAHARGRRPGSRSRSRRAATSRDDGGGSDEPGPGEPGHHDRDVDLHHRRVQIGGAS